MTFHYTKGFRRDAPLIVDIASTFVCEDTRAPVLSCKCGRSHLADAALRARRDPTRTLDLRRKFIRSLEKRWKRVSRLVTEAVATQDMFGLSLANAHALQIVAMSSGRVPAFQQWIDAALADTILGMDRELWIGGFIREAYQRGWTTATLQVGRDLPLNIDRADIITKLTIAELQGVIEAFSQRAVRAFSDGLMSHLPPATVARSIRKEVDKVGIVRSRMTVQSMVVRANGEAALDCFQTVGRTHVDVLPETMPSPGRMHAIRDAKARSRRARRRGTRSATVEVLTAGDDDVCIICQDISESGPYAIADARGLIPAHPNCRCAFVPAYDKRFAHGDAWNEEDHPRAPDGKFGEVAYHGTISPFAKNILKEGLKTNSIGRVFLAKSKARALIEARKFVGSNKVKPVVFTLHVPKSQFKTFKNDPALPGKAVYRERDIPASWIVSHKVYKDADEEYVVVYAVILVPESDLQDGIVWHDGFDPDEPRNERGEWTAEETIEMAKTQRELLAAIRAKKAGEQRGEAFINIPSPAQKIRNAEIMFGTGSPQHKAAIKKFGTKDEWNEEDHPREPAGGPGGGEFTGNGGDLASIAKKFDDSKEYAELSAKLNAGQITNKQFDKATGKLHDLNSIDVKVYRVGSAEMAPRGIHFGDSPQSIEAYTSIHPGQEIKEYRIEAGKTGVTRNHMTLHQHLFGSDFRNAVEAEDRRSGSKSYVAAAERVEGRMAKEARKRGYEAIIYTHPPLPAKHELVLLKKDAIVSADEATIVLTHGYRVVRGDGLKIGQIFRDPNEAKLARDVQSLDAGEGSQVWEVDVSDIEGAEADETAVYLPAGTSFEVVGFDQSRGVWNIDARDGFDPDEPRDPDGKWTTGEGGSVLHEKTIEPKTPDAPIGKSIVHDPSTGAKKPFEVWARYASGNKRRFASFSSESAALKSHWWKDAWATQDEWNEEDHPRDPNGEFASVGSPNWDKIKNEVARARAQEALRKWQSDYERINGELREDEGESWREGLYAGTITDLTNAVRGAGEKLKEDIVTWRGIGGMGVSSFPSVGKEFIDQGFVSLSTSKRVAVGFTTGLEGIERDDKTLLKITVEKGSRVVQTPGGAHGQVEKELLLNRGTRFKVTGVKGRVVSLTALKQ